VKSPEEIAEAHALHRDAVVKLGPQLYQLFRQVGGGLTPAEMYLVMTAVEAALEWVLDLPPKNGESPLADTIPLIRAALREATAHERN
jgi:hypothetical protein